jgi:hypothetical protein
MLTNLPADLDTYLPADSMAWCKQAMANIGAPERPTSRLFFQQRPSEAIVIPAWYSLIINVARSFNRPNPRLHLLPSPTGVYDWIPHPQVDKALNREFDDVDPDQLSEPEPFKDDSSTDSGGE